MTAKKVNEIESELTEGMKLAKCKKCRCMKSTLESMKAALTPLKHVKLSETVEDLLKKTQPTEYDCLGCQHCYPAEALNRFNQTYPEIIPPSCGTEDESQRGFSQPGEYIAFPDDADCLVAVSTLASVELPQKIADMHPKGLCIVGKTETENIGIDKLIKNIITNPRIRHLILAGKDPKGHHSGQTILALWNNGVDENMKVIGSSGMRPILRNVNKEVVEAFRKQIQVTDMTGCEDPEKIVKMVGELTQKQVHTCGCKECKTDIRPAPQAKTPVIQATEPAKQEIDKEGYFVIMPQPEKKTITVEHYSLDNKLLRTIEGKNARSIYKTIIENKWITQLTHAAYLGKELSNAELSNQKGFKYVQDSV